MRGRIGPDDSGSTGRERSDQVLDVDFARPVVGRERCRFEKTYAVTSTVSGRVERAEQSFVGVQLGLDSMAEGLGCVSGWIGSVAVVVGGTGE
nr:hypothetical protein CFP56_77300 [Quercus suber]